VSTLITILPILISALVAGIFGALKYYSNTLGPNPETFDLSKFAPIMILSIIISVGFAVFNGVAMTPEGITEFVTANFVLVLFANTVWTVITKWYYKTYPQVTTGP
jgi:hypothetical protein